MLRSDVLPSILGASDGDLHTFALSGKPWYHRLPAEDLIAGLFLDLVNTATAAQQRTERRQLHDSPAKRNRRESYLDARKRGQWEARSLCFLSRIPDIAMSLSTEALYSTLAMQHFLEVDATDQRLPPGERHSEDIITDGVSDQFLIDAPRGRFKVDGEVFYFQAADPSESKDDFVARLVSAVRKASHPALLVNVTSAMSQSGLAALERACLCRVAVSGGTQEVDYGLESNPRRRDVVIVKLQVRRRGFRSYIIDGGDVDPLKCDVQSSLRKAAVVRFSLDGNVDVIDLEEDVHILQGGHAVPVETVCKPIPRAPRPRTYTGECKPRLGLGTPECRIGPGSASNVECRVNCSIL